MNSHEGDVDIFSLSAPEIPFGKFFYHREVGDFVKGTYIDNREGKDTFGNDQRIFVLLDDNEVWNVGVRLTSTFLLEAMKAKRFGDIIGFRLDELRANKKNPGYKPTKIINVYPKNIQGPVDTVWLAEQEALKARGYVRPSHSISQETTPVQKTSEEKFFQGMPADPIFDQVKPLTQAIHKEQPKPVLSVNSEGNNAIRNLAKTKGLVTDAMSPEEADTVISTMTGLPLIDENFGQIIIKLSGYTK